MRNVLTAATELAEGADQHVDPVVTAVLKQTNDPEGWLARHRKWVDAWNAAHAPAQPVDCGCRVVEGTLIPCYTHGR